MYVFVCMCDKGSLRHTVMQIAAPCNPHSDQRKNEYKIPFYTSDIKIIITFIFFFSVL